MKAKKLKTLPEIYIGNGRTRNVAFRKI